MGRVRKVAIWGRKKNKETEPENREDKKKVGLLRRLMQKIRNIDWKDPVTRWKVMFISLITLIVVGGGSYGVLTMTNSPSFCASCHEMAPEYTTFTASAHSEISCVQCHIKPGAINMITHKMISLKEVYYHVTGVPEQIVQTKSEAITDQNCLQCHSKNRIVTPSGDLKVNHEGHIDEGVPCISCHAGVVHAKIVARGINVEEVRGHFTKETAEKIMERKYLAPNMGSCIDCHDKVNNGEKPWTDVTYLVPPNPEHVEKELDVQNKKSGESTSGEQKAAAHDDTTQKHILQVIGKQKDNVKVSMECQTCHKQLDTPASHKAADWNKNHGGNAFNELDQCMNCHQESKWFKEIPQEDLISLLKMKESEDKDGKYKPNMNLVKEEARINQFCSACHSDRPDSHGDSKVWLKGHAGKANSADQKAECFVCHDRDKPKADSTNPKAPTDVYCQYCHRTGFNDDGKN